MEFLKDIKVPFDFYGEHNSSEPSYMEVYRPGIGNETELGKRIVYDYDTEPYVHTCLLEEIMKMDISPEEKLAKINVLTAKSNPEFLPIEECQLENC